MFLYQEFFYHHFFSRQLFRLDEILVHVAYLKECPWDQFGKESCDFPETPSSESSSFWITSTSEQRMFMASHGYRLPSCVTSSCATGSSGDRAWKIISTLSLMWPDPPPLCSKSDWIQVLTWHHVDEKCWPWLSPQSIFRIGLSNTP